MGKRLPNAGLSSERVTLTAPARFDSTHRPNDERVGIVTPMANEADTVELFLSGVVEQIAAGDIVFCVLDNVSKDGTRGLVEEFGGKDPRVKLVWAPENRCVVDAYVRGYREAMAAGCDWILEMDAGMSHDPATIPLFLDAMASGVDFAAGSRFVPGGSHQGRLSRYWISKGGTLLARLLLGSKMHDMTGGFECFNRRAMQSVLDRGVNSRGHFFQTEIRHHLIELELGRSAHSLHEPVEEREDRDPDGGVAGITASPPREGDCLTRDAVGH